MIRAACGIVGLPNVGKSTLFNALAQSQLAHASNFPFCTIEPNVAKVVVPDRRLEKLAKLGKSQKVINTTLELHDIAGLIKGASEGQGLGNKFLGNIRNVSLIVHVLRCFENSDIHHVAMDSSGKSDPVDDLSVVETELMLSDLGSIEKRLAKKKRDTNETELLEKIRELLESGKAPTEILGGEPKTKEEGFLRSELKQQLLSAKPVLYVCNTDEVGVTSKENDMIRAVRNELKRRGDKMDPVVVCAGLEEEALTLFDSEEDRMNYLAEFGINSTGLDKIASSCAKLLGQSVFYTVGEQEARAWSIPQHCTAQEAASKIHSDIARGFICAETISYDDYIHYGTEKLAREAGKLRSEGRDYLVQSGDVMNFKFNV